MKVYDLVLLFLWRKGLKIWFWFLQKNGEKIISKRFSCFQLHQSRGFGFRQFKLNWLLSPHTHSHSLSFTGTHSSLSLFHLLHVRVSGYMIVIQNCCFLLRRRRKGGGGVGRKRGAGSNTFFQRSWRVQRRRLLHQQTRQRQRGSPYFWAAQSKLLPNRQTGVVWVLSN